MKMIKCIAVISLLLTLTLPQFAEQRAKREVTEKELTDPKSTSYVPYPYPGNRKEIIADLKHFVNTFIDDGSAVNGTTEQLLIELFAPKSQYKISRIIKVQNRIAGLPDDYNWLILVSDKKGHITLRAFMLATGLVGACGSVVDEDLENSSPRQRKRLEGLRKLITDKEVTHYLAGALGRDFEKNEIKELKRVVYLSTLGSFLFPTWEIEMKDGSKYCYIQKRDMVYSMESTSLWRKNSNGLRTSPAEMVTHRNYLPDTVNDQIIILKELPRK